jgi:hypothetical protein
MAGVGGAPAIESVSEDEDRASDATHAMCRFDYPECPQSCKNQSRGGVEPQRKTRLRDPALCPAVAAARSAAKPVIPGAAVGDAEVVTAQVGIGVGPRSLIGPGSGRRFPTRVPAKHSIGKCFASNDTASDSRPCCETTKQA